MGHSCIGPLCKSKLPASKSRQHEGMMSSIENGSGYLVLGSCEVICDWCPACCVYFMADGRGSAVIGVTGCMEGLVVSDHWSSCDVTLLT